MSNLYYTVGLPRSFKTTFCKKWVQEKPGRVIISGDAFRKAITGNEYNPLSEASVFTSMDIAIRALLSTGHQVIVDETATTPETIKRYLRIDRNAEPVWFDVSAEECIKRAIATQKPYLVGPIKRMDKQLKYLKENWFSITLKILEELISREKDDITI